MARSFLEWLFSEAGAGWIFGFVSLAALILSFFRRKKADRIIVREVGKSSFIKIPKSISDQIKVTFNDKLVGGIGQIETEIFNEGSSVVKNLELRIVLPKDSQILGISLSSSTGEFKVRTEFDGHMAKIEVPYLNPLKEHKHILRLFTLVDGRTDHFYVEGAGEGWSVRYIPPPSLRQIQWRIYAILAGALLLLSSNYFYSRWLEKLNIDTSRVNLTTFLLYLPLFLLGAGLGYMTYRLPRRRK